MFDAKAITNNFIDLYIDHDIIKKISNVTAQKLNYIAHGLWLVVYDSPLIEEPFQAWKWGPVVPSLYHRLKRFGSEHIDYCYPLVAEDSGMVIIERVHKTSVEKLLNFIFEAYKDYTAGELIDLTHSPTGAWYEAYTQKGQNAIIDNESIKKEFHTLFQ